MYLELLWGNQCEWILDRQLQPGEGSPNEFLLQPLKWDHRSQASQSCAYWYHLQGRTGMSEADQGPLSTSNWSRNHRSQGLWAGVPAGPVLVFEGVHACRCTQVHLSVSCCALTHLSWLKGDCGAWRRVLNNHQYNPRWEWFKHMHRLASYSREYAFMMEFSPHQVKRSEETWLSTLRFYTSSDSVLCGCWRCTVTCVTSPVSTARAQPRYWLHPR